MFLGWILSGHDVSDGGLITTVLECAFAGNRSVDCNLNFEQIETINEERAIREVFAEELGLILEIDSQTVLRELLKDAEYNQVKVVEIGKCYPVFGPKATVSF